MRVEMRALLATGFMAVTLAGCGTSDILGGGKDAPDEFAIVTKQPLIIPPEFNLHPPRPGSPPANQISPTDAAQTALFADDPAQIASTIQGTYSPAEKMLIAKAGAANASDSIRQIIAADNKNLSAADNDFTGSLLFGGSSSADSDAPLDADAERARLGARASGRPVADAGPMPDQTIAPEYAPSTGAPAVSGALPPVGAAAQAPPRSMPTAAPAPMASAPVASAPPQTASTPTYYAPAGPAVAGTLPPIGGDSSAAPARPARPARKAHKDDDGWLDGIF